MNTSFITYILLCSDGSFYTGWTNDIVKRMDAHNKGLGSKYTRTRLPVKLAAKFIAETKNEAMSLEYKIKKLNRKQKINLIAENSSTL